MSKYFAGFIHAVVLLGSWWVYFYTPWNNDFIVIVTIVSIATFVALLSALGCHWDC